MEELKKMIHDMNMSLVGIGNAVNMFEEGSISKPEATYAIGVCHGHIEQHIKEIKDHIADADDNSVEN